MYVSSVGASIPKTTERTFPAPALSRAGNSGRVVNSKHSSQDALQAFAGQRCCVDLEENSQDTHAPALPPAENSEMIVDSTQNSQDAPRASGAAARPKQREGR